MFRDFWVKFKAARGDGHKVFTDHAGELEFCIPVMLHGDEGRGKLHRAVMATSVQPAILPDGHAGHSFNSRLLHSIMPGELYEGDMTVQILQDALVEDLRSLYLDGFEVPWSNYMLYVHMMRSHAWSVFLHMLMCVGSPRSKARMEGS